jgi:hypothetical protein
MEILNKALLIYYFNIIMISLIIFIVLLAYYNKAKSVIINSGERSASINKSEKFPPTVKYVVVFGLIFFTVREYGSDLLDVGKGIIDWIGGLIG